MQNTKVINLKRKDLQMNVQNMTSSKGNAIPNQFIVTDEKGTYFQSYESMIVFIPNDSNRKTQLDKKTWDYSNTTGKYRNQFLNETKKETEKKIASGEYILTDLN